MCDKLKMYFIEGSTSSTNVYDIVIDEAIAVFIVPHITVENPTVLAIIL